MCGIVGAWFPVEAEEAGINIAELLAVMTAGQQHRGHEGAGINTVEREGRKEFGRHKGLGLVFDVFSKETLDNLNHGSHCGIGHNRYSTTGKPSFSNLQPFYSVIGDGDDQEQISVAHNGNLTSKLTGIRPSKSDTWAILHNLDGINHKPLHLQIFQSLRNLDGAFSLVYLYQDKNGNNSLICVRDPHGIRPLWLAKYKFRHHEKDCLGYLAASETCAFDKVPGADIWRPVKPGEVVIINDNGIKSFRPKAWRNQQIRRCIFELIYFMHPTSILETRNFKKNPVYAFEVQEAFGAKLALETGLTANAVCGVPDSSNYHTAGFSAITGICRALVIIRNHSVGRTFITPTGEQDERGAKISRKFSFVWKRLLEIPVIVLIEDSLVRGNTLKKIIEIIRNRAEKVNKKLKIIVGVASPPVTYPCFQGVDISTKEELAWNRFCGHKGVQTAIKADALHYLTVEGMFQVVEEVAGCQKCAWCAACFTGEYPVGIAKEEYLRELRK